jgi:hypothetical protein
MAATRRPRNIRDIAHLYLSRRQNFKQPPALNIFLAGQSKDCFSGFHVANLAAAFAVRGAKVRVFELSGLLPNAAFYFSHPPGVYLKALRGKDREFSPALNAISVTFDSIRLMSERPATEELRVDLIHLPTMGDGEEHSELLSNLRDRCQGERWGLFVRRDEEHSRDRLFYHRLGASATFTLSLSKSNGSSPVKSVASKSLGSIAKWETAVEDRVPIVARNPNSGLAREYLSICESILGQINSLRRNGEIEQPIGFSRARTAR